MAFQSALIWPCIVARRGLFACGFGKRLNAMYAFHQQDHDYLRCCFARRAIAEAFAAEFSGERTILGIALILGGIIVSVMASPNKTDTRTETDVTNDQIYRGMTGLRVSLPSDMKNFPVELVPLP
jgi:hypothetical protein